MTLSITRYLPLFWVDVVTFFTILPLSVLIYCESLTNTLRLRQDVPILGLSLSSHDYRLEMFKDPFNICCFIVWTSQLLVNLYVVYYHVTKPHHPKFYVTLPNKISILCHIVGGAISTIGFYVGALLNMKVICIVAAASGVFLHFPTQGTIIPPKR